MRTATPRSVSQSKSRVSQESQEPVQVSIQRSQAIEKALASQQTQLEKLTEQKTLERRRDSLKRTQSLTPKSTLAVSKTQATERRARSRRSGKWRKEDRSKTARNQRDDATPQNMKTPSKDKQKAQPIEAKSGRAQQNLKELKNTQDEEFVTLAKLDEEPTIVQKPPNRYEADAGQKKMVVDPVLVMKRGNIDNMYTKMKSQFINQMREAELPSDRDIENLPAKPKQLKLRFNDEKCVVYETNDEPTIDDAEEMGPEQEEDIY